MASKAPLSPVELEIELFCLGMVIDAETRSDLEARRIARTRAGLGSGLEIIVPSPLKKIWVNVPVEEAFASRSPLSLVRSGEGYAIHDTRTPDIEYPVEIPPEPAWYSRTTTRGTLMSRVGVLQGNYLGIFLSNTCLYWYSRPAASNCRFCTSGKNVGVNEIAQKNLDDVVEVSRAAQAESGSVFTHFNTGYQYEENPKRRSVHGLMQAKPYVSAIRERVGGFIGVQAVPVLKENYDEYDELIEAGTDHFSFCVEFLDPKVFEEVCPGKNETVGQEAFFDAMAYTSKKLGKGRVSGEIIAGVEPIETTMKAIDRIVETGAFPTVCIFRPLTGSDLETFPPPDPAAMRQVMAYQYEACRNAGIPVGVLPIEVSLVVQPEEGRQLLEDTGAGFYEFKVAAMKTLAKPYVNWKLKPRQSESVQPR
jgi:hypothetical protein